MNPELRLEVPDTLVRIRRPADLQRGQLNQNERSRSSRLSLNDRVEPIDLNPPTTPKDDQRKRKSLSSVISIPESSNPEPHCSKRGKDAVQEVEDESCRRPTFRDNKGKVKLDDDFQFISADQPGLNSPPRRVGQRLLVRSSTIAPSNTARRNEAFNRGRTGGGLGASTAGGEHNHGPALRDNKGKGKVDRDASKHDICEISTDQLGSSVPPRPMKQRWLMRNGVISLTNIADNHDICEISADQSGSSVPPRPVKQRWLVRNGVIAPRNVAERTAASNNGRSREVANAPEQSELEADQKVALTQPSAFMQRESGGYGLQPAGSSYVGGASDDEILSAIVADDPCGGVLRSRRELGAIATSNTSSSGSTQNYRPGRLNETSTGSARPDPAVPSTPIHVTARPIFGASTSSYSTGEIGANSQIGRIGSLSSLHGGGISSMSQNLRTQAFNRTVAARVRGRIIRAQGVVLQPVIDVDETHSPDSGAAARAQQLAHDEMIARRLQEELYNEIPGDWSMEEMDGRIAMSLQQEENAMRAPPIHRTASRTVRSAEFVASSSLVRNNAAQQMYQHFNPRDYEALLVLDEDNHLHTGASTSQINSLPESIVKTCKLDESCAVCLETPSIGEKIRHLPCLHKFHKDCIDQWLQRKKECPICKCSIF